MVKSWEKLGKVGKSGEGGKTCFFLILDKMATGGHFGCPKITFDHSSCHWMNNACVKFEERSLNPSKVIALTTKLCGGRRWRCGGGCVAVENIISPKTYVSREYNKFFICGKHLWLFGGLGGGGGEGFNNQTGPILVHSYPLFYINLHVKYRSNMITRGLSA